MRYFVDFRKRMPLRFRGITVWLGIVTAASNLALLLFWFGGRTFVILRTLLFIFGLVMTIGAAHLRWKLDPGGR